MVIIASFHHSFIEMVHQQRFMVWYFKINADINILDKSVILGLPCCVFAGYSVLTYPYDSLNYWLSDRIETIGFGKLFDDWYVKYY